MSCSTSLQAADASDRPNLTNTEVDGRPAWATGDLLEQHPTKPTLWKVLGREDDQIVFSTGRMVSIVYDGLGLN